MVWTLLRHSRRGTHLTFLDESEFLLIPNVRTTRLLRPCLHASDLPWP